MDLRRFGVSIVIAVASLCSTGCSKSFAPEAGSESHFLQRCTRDDQCGASLSCLGAVCTSACTRDDSCAALSSESFCRRPQADAEGACDVACDEDLVCEAVDDAFGCRAGFCRSTATSVPALDAGPDGG